MWDTFFEQASRLRAAGEPFAFATVVACQRPTAAYPGAKALIRADGTLTGWVGGSCAQPTVIQEALKALADGQSRLLRISPELQHSAVPQEGVYDFVMTCASQGALEIFVEPFLPRPALLVIGETPVAQALARFGALLDFTVCVSDPAATRERFPDADTLCADLEAIRARVNPRSFVVVATQGAYDEEALAAVIDTPACYLGLVASGKRAATIFRYLRDKGVQPELIQRVKCPAGLQLGAVTPPEIAFSIMGEILQLRRSNTAGDGARVAVPAADVLSDTAVVDPVCGMTIQIAGARYTSAYAGKTFLFCGVGCKERFDREPERFLSPLPEGEGVKAAGTENTEYPSMKKFISGLILAAGTSSRMGQPKQLLPFRGTILLDWVMAQAEAASALDEVIVVLGQAADAIRPRLRNTRAKVIINPVFTEGCSGSYKAGMATIDPRAEAVMVLLGDQPGVDSAVIDQVAEDWRTRGGRIALTSYRGRRGHPMVFACELFEQLRQLSGDKAAWKILDAHPDWVRDVAIDHAFPEDVDTRQDYEALLRASAAPVSS